MVYTEFREAFDKVHHNWLLYKLRNVGVGGNLLTWIKDFLVGRQQSVQADSNLFSWRIVFSGGP